MSLERHEGEEEEEEEDPETFLSLSAHTSSVGLSSGPTPGSALRPRPIPFTPTAGVSMSNELVGVNNQMLIPGDNDIKTSLSLQQPTLYMQESHLGGSHNLKQKDKDDAAVEEEHPKVEESLYTAKCEKHPTPMIFSMQNELMIQSSSSEYIGSSAHNLSHSEDKSLGSTSKRNPVSTLSCSVDLLQQQAKSRPASYLGGADDTNSNAPRTNPALTQEQKNEELSGFPTQTYVEKLPVMPISPNHRQYASVHLSEEEEASSWPLREAHSPTLSQGITSPKAPILSPKNLIPHHEQAPRLSLSLEQLSWHDTTTLDHFPSSLHLSLEKKRQRISSPPQLLQGSFKHHKSAFMQALPFKGITDSCMLTTSNGIKAESLQRTSESIVNAPRPHVEFTEFRDENHVLFRESIISNEPFDFKGASEIPKTKNPIDLQDNPQASFLASESLKYPSLNGHLLTSVGQGASSRLQDKLIPLFPDHIVSSNQEQVIVENDHSERIYPAPLATHATVIADKKLFTETLQKLHAAIGLQVEVPKIGEEVLDLHKLYKEVTDCGGLEKVTKERKWKEIARAILSGVMASTRVLRRTYVDTLHHYEQVYFFGVNGKIIPPPESPTHSKEKDAESSQQSVVGETKSMKYRSYGIIDSAQALGVDPASSIGTVVTGAIDGKFENGYLVTVMVGTRKMRGVLYHASSNNRAPQNACVPGMMQSVGLELNLSNLTPKPMVGRKRKKNEVFRKDPNAPRQNRTGYNFFFAEQRAKLKTVQPDKDRAISKMIGELWNKLSEDEKYPYQAQGLKDKERYVREMKEYKEKSKHLPPRYH